MNALSRAARIAAADGTERRLALEALFYLMWARVLILLPYARYSRYLGRPMTESSLQEGGVCEALADRVSLAVRRAAKLSPLDTRCLVRAMAAMRMLRRRGVESTLYLGTAKDKDGRMIAHAWLRCGSRYVTGAEEMRGFTVVGRFAR
ncbi:lasso peptide biosynthesis B2 protein [Cohnella sp. JJ-181]|uniref:lasso peptide biosynthesis B2 protein n=1 Tax=Cohnella rhizoplanae TaxID=2974897 RepID=UPI0022FFAA67|nr:lasso peptide biosynthesis B2 protein [Cohnella sp. JJ-181]CAI6036527.1 hypothetical protein COHCIP112018_00914 [Cohnella sp. JJ-181]